MGHAYLGRNLIDRTLGSDRSSGVEVDEESISDIVNRFRGSEASGEEVLEPKAVEVLVLLAIGSQLREAWQAVDAVDMSLMFQHRPEVMRSVPHFSTRPFRNAMLIALDGVKSCSCCCSCCCKDVAPYFVVAMCRDTS